MNKISLYILLILMFLGLSKSFAPSEKKTAYIENEKIFSNYFYGAPISILLIDSFKTGFLIKTYFQKYKVVHGFKHPETIIVRTSKSFWRKNLNNKGMSLFRRDERENKESIVPMPPGTLYLGDPAYGRWRTDDSGGSYWKFHRAYRHFPRIFNWGDFRPTKSFYNSLKIYLSHENSFYGLNKEFGSKGSVILENLKDESLQAEMQAIDYIKHIDNYFNIPPWKKEK